VGLDLGSAQQIFLIARVNLYVRNVTKYQSTPIPCFMTVEDDSPQQLTTLDSSHSIRGNYYKGGECNSNIVDWRRGKSALRSQFLKAEEVLGAGRQLEKFMFNAPRSSF